MSSHPGVKGGTQHGGVQGGHALLGARPKEVDGQGAGRVPHSAQHEGGAVGYTKGVLGDGGDYRGGGYAPGVYSAEALQELRRIALGDDEEAYIPGIWNGLW